MFTLEFTDDQFVRHSTVFDDVKSAIRFLILESALYDIHSFVGNNIDIFVDRRSKIETQKDDS